MGPGDAGGCATPVEFYYPISAAPHDLPAGMDQWANNGGANKNASSLPGGGRAGPMTHDDNTSYISEVTNAEDQAINIDWPGPISDLGATFTAWFRRGIDDGGGGADASTTRFRFANAAGATSSSDIQSLAATFAWTTYGPVDVSNATNFRPGGGAWSQADFDDDQSLFFWVDISGLVNDTVKVTSFWGEIEYVSAGGFVFMLQLAGLGALPFVGRMADMVQFRSYLSWRRRFHRRHTLLTGDEVRQAWDELKAYRYPTFFLPRLEAAR